jgi:hypothetical protein
LVEAAFARYHSVCFGQRSVQVLGRRNEVEPWHQFRAKRSQPAPEPARRATAHQRAHIDAVFAYISLRYSFQPLDEDAHLNRVSTLLRPEDRRCVQKAGPDITCDPDDDSLLGEGLATESIDRAKTAVSCS